MREVVKWPPMVQYGQEKVFSLRSRLHYTTTELTRSMRSLALIEAPNDVEKGRTASLGILIVQPLAVGRSRQLHAGTYMREVQ